MLTLSRRGISIMRYLLNSEQAVSSEVLASILGTTSKTIRGDIELIDAILESVGANVVSKSGSGYTIEVNDRNEFSIFLDSFNEKYNNNIPLPLYNEERINYIIHYLLLSESYVKADYFIDKLFISRTTLTQDLRHVRLLLGKYHLNLLQKPNYGMKIEGKEEHLRMALIDYLFIDEDMVVMEENDFRLTLDTKGCMDAMKYVLLKTKVHISFKSLRDLSNLIAVCEYRRRNGFFIKFNDIQREELKELEEYGIARRIYYELNIETSDDEISFLALYIATRRIYSLNDSFSLIENKSLFFLCDEMLKFLFIYTNVNFLSDEDVRQLMTRELRGFLLRINYKMEYKSIQNMEIKSMCPTFEYALLMTDYLNKKYGYEIPENEVAQLTLILQQSISKYNLNYKKQRVCLVFYRGHFGSYSIYNQLNKGIGEYIKSIGTCEFHELTKDIDKHYDLIITDMPRVKFNCTIPVYQVLNRFDHMDLLKVKRLLLHRKEEYGQFIKRFERELIFYDLDVSTKEQALKFLCTEMSKKLNLSSALEQAVFAKEKISSSERGNNVALSHSLFPVCEKTKIAMAILKKPIIWDDEIVQLLFVVANGNNEDYVYMTPSLIQLVLKNIFAIHELISAKSFEEIEQIFMKELVLKNTY